MKRGTGRRAEHLHARQVLARVEPTSTPKGVEPGRWAEVGARTFGGPEQCTEPLSDRSELEAASDSSAVSSGLSRLQQRGQIGTAD